MSVQAPHATDPADRQGPASAVRKHMRSLMAKALVYFAEREANSLERVRNHLLDLIDARPSETQVQNLRSAHALLGKQAGVFNAAFRAALQSTMDAEARLALPDAVGPEAGAPVPESELDGMSLSLIDMAEVERILLLDRVAQRFATYYDADLTPLTQRLGVLLQWSAPTPSRNPFRPEVFVRAFLQAWENCDLDAQATEHLMMSLEPRYCIDLSPLYTDLNAMLIQAGVAAQTTLRIKKSTGMGSGHAPLGSSVAAQASNSAPAPLSGAQGTPESGGARSAWAALAPAGRSIAAHARQFLQRLGLGSPSGNNEDAIDGAGIAADAADLHAGADPEFMGYLGGLQAGEGAAPTYQDGQQPGDYNILRLMRDREEVRRAPELDRGTVDALAEVFDFVFADQAIPLQMKFVIGRLQIPVLKAAMIDRDFFLSADHPARRLVDTLATASIAWSPEQGEQDPLYLRIEGTVMRVLNEFEDDLELFSALLRDFTEFLFETEQQAQGRIEPAARQASSGESYEQALAHVDEVVHARLNALAPEQPLAPFLTPFLTNPWREVMARAWMQVQTDPAAWQQAQSTMDQLIWSTQPKTSAQERRQLVAVLPDLVRSLNTELDAIEWVGDARATFTRRLIATHMMAIRMTQPVPLDTGSAALDVQASQEAMSELDQRRAEKLTATQDAFDALAQSFKRGLWFESVGQGTAPYRCLLSWVSPMRTRFLFTNREGFDAFVRTEREVASLLRQGQLRVLDQMPIVARALDRILGAGEVEPSVALRGDRS